MFSANVAVDSKFGISKEGKIPWNCPEDLAFFKEVTTGNVVIMGRKTWESLPIKPLPNRVNVVISKTLPESKDYTLFKSYKDCVRWFSENINKPSPIKNVVDNPIKYRSLTLFVIGGESIYRQFLEDGIVKDVHLTQISGDYECDLHFKPSRLMKIETKKYLSQNPLTRYAHCRIQNLEELNFLSVMNEILTSQSLRMDRTGTGTLSVFSRELRFNLGKGKIPLLTTRPVSLRYVFEELMWILRGQTNNKILNEKKIHIWDDNSSREFLDKRGLHHLPEGDIGPSYGFQMRNFGAQYEGGHKNGFDQLSYVINLLKTNPHSRRILINLWNPSQLDEMALPPCVYGYQFFVSNKRLSCKIIQRSSDIALAGSHNCVGGAILTRMLCSITGYLPGELIWSPSDIHIYLNQIKSVEIQLSRNPFPFPLLEIVDPPEDILDFKFENFKLLGYNPQSKIKFAMNA